MTDPVYGYTESGADAKFIDNGELVTDLAPYAKTADLATVATSGSYTDLLNPPTIPAAQVQTDWNASTGLASIANKPATFPPTIGTTATTAMAGDTVLVDSRFTFTSPVDGDVVQYDSSSGEFVNTPLDFSGIAGTAALAQMTPGATFRVIWSATVNSGAGGWTYVGAYITARPTARTDIFMDAVDYVGGSTQPSFAITGDSYEVKSA